VRVCGLVLPVDFMSDVVIRHGTLGGCCLAACAHLGVPCVRRADAVDWRADAGGLNGTIESAAVCMYVCGPRWAHDCVRTDAIELVPSCRHPGTA